MSGQTIPDLYTTEAGETLTTCGAHRTLGFYVSGTGIDGEPVWACRDCGSVKEWHETTDETVARRRAEQAAAAERTIALCHAATGGPRIDRDAEAEWEARTERTNR